MSATGRTRVVVTGMGTVNPIAKTLEEYWDSLIEGRSGSRPTQNFPADRLVTKFCCQVQDFEPEKYMDRKVAQRTARFSQLALAASSMAVQDSGLDLGSEDPWRVGVELGTGIGGFDMMTEDAHRYLAGGRLQPLYATMIIPNIAAAQVAMQYGVKGPNSTGATPT